jgi:hypothetical protein
MGMTRIVAVALAGWFHAGMAVAQGSMTLVSGDRQSLGRSGSEVTGGIAGFEPLVVVVKDAKGKPVSGATVRFECGTRPATMVCQLESFGEARAAKDKGDTASAPVTAKLTPSGWTGTGGQLVAYAQGTGSAKGGSSSILSGLAPPAPAVTVRTDERGMATLRRMRGKSVWAYGADGELQVRAVYESQSVPFRLSVRR